MEENKLISLTHLCGHYKIEVSFIHDLDQYGLLQIIRDQEEEFLDAECLSQLETLMRLHYDLNINMEGLDAISHMLERMKAMQKELTALRNRLGHS